MRALIVVAVCLVAPHLASAAETEPPGKRAFEKGAHHFRHKRYDVALPYFQEAYDLSGRRPSTIVALAQCERALGLYDDALEHFREYLATKLKPQEAKLVRKTIAQLEEKRRKERLTSNLESAPVPIEQPKAAEETPPIEEPKVAEATPPAASAAPSPTPAPSTGEPTEASDAPESTIGESGRIGTARPTAPITPKRDIEEESSPPPSYADARTYTPSTTSVTHSRMRERGPGAAPWVLAGTGAAAAVTGVVLLVLGRSESARLSDAPDGASFRGTYSEAAERGPFLSTVGTTLLTAGLVGAGAGITWFLLEDQ